MMTEEVLQPQNIMAFTHAAPDFGRRRCTGVNEASTRRYNLLIRLPGETMAGSIPVVHRAQPQILA